MNPWKKKFPAISLMLITVLFTGSAWGAASLDPKIKQQLDAGKIVTSIEQNPHTKVYAPTGQAVVDAPVEDVWHVIIDFNSFGEFMPNTIFYRPVGWKDGRLFVDCRIKVALLTMD